MTIRLRALCDQLHPWQAMDEMRDSTLPPGRCGERVLSCSAVGKPKRKTVQRKRPGMPRKTHSLDRITLRIATPLADKMNEACEDLNLTQRDFVEAAIRLYCETPLNGTEKPEPTPDIYRTGMWIDPEVVAMLDGREADEGLRQRAILERAIELKLKQAGRA